MVEPLHTVAVAEMPVMLGSGFTTIVFVALPAQLPSTAESVYTYVPAAVGVTGTDVPATAVSSPLPLVAETVEYV